MSTIHPTYPEVARHEVTRRLRAADEERLRRLARHPSAWADAPALARRAADARSSRSPCASRLAY
jgi:hypothetical protein